MSNYRHVSLTVICCKLPEHVIYNFIMEHFEACNILTEHQNGFHMARSCTPQLIIATNGIAHNFANGLQTDLILFDFSKSFDKFSHRNLLHKFQYYGMCGISNNFSGGQV